MAAGTRHSQWGYPRGQVLFSKCAFLKILTPNERFFSPPAFLSPRQPFPRPAIKICRPQSLGPSSFASLCPEIHSFYPVAAGGWHGLWFFRLGKNESPIHPCQPFLRAPPIV